MKWARSIGILILLFAVSTLAVWQQMRIRQLSAQCLALQDQLQALARPEQANPPASPGSRSDGHSEQSSSSELLRLRGEVALLRRQLAEASSQSKSDSVARTQSPNESQVAAVDPDLKTREEQLDAARQKLRDVMAALQIGTVNSEADVAANLSPDDLQSYLKAKRGVEELERLVDMLKLKQALGQVK